MAKLDFQLLKVMMMWLNCTRSRIGSADVEKVVKILGSEASMSPIRAARGFQGLYLVESTESPGEVISITIWDSAEEGQAYLASPECWKVVESIQAYLVRPLERNYYQVLIQTGMEKEVQAT